jgi:uncharacterized protein YqhQ
MGELKEFVSLEIKAINMDSPMMNEKSQGASKVKIWLGASFLTFLMFFHLILFKIITIMIIIKS